MVGEGAGASGLVQGPWTVRIEAEDGGSWTATAVVRAGEVTTVHLREDPGQEAEDPGEE